MQYGKEVTGTDYDGLKKVYSIWLCVNCPEKYADTITRYYLEKDDVFGRYEEEGHDLLEIVMVRLRGTEKRGTATHPLLRMAEVTLSDRMSADEKKRILQQECEIPMTEEVERRLWNMCNLSEGIIERGLKEGMEQGLQQGLKEGQQKGRADMLVALYQEGELTEEVAERKLRELGYSLKEWIEKRQGDDE